MATMRSYLVSFSPAERTRDNTFLIHITNQSPAATVEAASLDELGQYVAQMAQAYGKTCSAYVRLKDRNARKPAGFDARFSSSSKSIYEMPTVEV